MIEPYDDSGNFAADLSACFCLLAETFDPGTLNQLASIEHVCLEAYSRVLSVPNLNYTLLFDYVTIS